MFPVEVMLAQYVPLRGEVVETDMLQLPLLVLGNVLV